MGFGPITNFKFCKYRKSQARDSVRCQQRGEREQGGWGWECERTTRRDGWRDGGVGKADTIGWAWMDSWCFIAAEALTLRVLTDEKRDGRWRWEAYSNEKSR